MISAAVSSTVAVSRVAAAAAGGVRPPRTVREQEQAPRRERVLQGELLRAAQGAAADPRSVRPEQRPRPAEPGAAGPAARSRAVQAYLQAAPPAGGRARSAGLHLYA